MVASLVTSKKKLSVYMPEDLKAEAERLAKADQRSLNNLIEVLVQNAVNNAKKEGKI